MFPVTKSGNNSIIFQLPVKVVICGTLGPYKDQGPTQFIVIKEGGPPSSIPVTLDNNMRNLHYFGTNQPNALSYWDSPWSTKEKRNKRDIYGSDAVFLTTNMRSWRQYAQDVIRTQQVVIVIGPLGDPPFSTASTIRCDLFGRRWQIRQFPQTDWSHGRLITWPSCWLWHLQGNLP